MAGSNQVQALIEIVGSDKITKIIDSVEKSFKEVRKEAKANEEITQKYGKTLGRVATASKKVADAVDGITERWSGVAMGVNAVMDIMGKAVDMVRAAHEQLKIGVQEGGIERRFASVTQAVGGAGMAMIELQRASSGALDETSIERIASRALTAGITLKQTSELFTIATKMASAGEGDQVDLTERLIQSFVERSDSMLKAAGLESDFGQVLGVTTKRLGVSTDALSENQKRQVVLQDSLPKLRKEYERFSTDTAVQMLGRMDAAMQDLQARARKFALQKTLLESSDQLSKSADGALVAMRKVNAGLQLISQTPLIGIKQDDVDTLNDVNKARGELVRLVQIDAAVREHVIAKIQEEALALVHKDEKVKTAAQASRRMQLIQASLAEQYGVQALLLPALSRNVANYNKAMGVSAGAVGGKVLSLKDLAAAQERQHRLNVRSVTDVEDDTRQLTKNSAAQARIADSMNLSSRSAELWKKALDSGTLGIDDQAAALRAIALAEEQKADRDFGQVVLNAKVAASMGRATQAAQLYRQAFSNIQSNTDLATISVRHFAAAADASTNSMLKMMAAQAAEQEQRLAFARLKGMVGLGDDADIKKRERALLAIKKRMARIIAPRVGGGAKKAEAGLGDTVGEGFESAADDVGGALLNMATSIEVVLNFEKKFTAAAAAADAGNQTLFDKHIERLKQRIKYMEIHNPEEAKVMAQMVDIHSSAHQKILDQKRGWADAMIELDQRVLESAHGSLAQAAASLGEVGGQFAIGLGNAIPIIREQGDQYNETVSKFGEGTKAQEAAIKKSVPGQLSAMGALTAGFISSTKKRATIQGLFELAASAQSFAIGDVKSGSLHALSSALYFATAAKSQGAASGAGGGAGGGAAAARQTPTTLNQAPQAGQYSGPQALTINFSGTVVGNDESAARELAALMRREMRWSNAGATGAM